MTVKIITPVTTPDHGPYPAAERYAAHHTGGDGVQFVHKAEVIGRRADTTGFQQAAEGVEHPGEGIDHQQVQRHVDPGDFRRFRVTADSEDVLPKRVLVHRIQTKKTAISAEGNVGQAERAPAPQTPGQNGRSGCQNRRSATRPRSRSTAS